MTRNISDNYIHDWSWATDLEIFDEISVGKNVIDKDVSFVKDKDLLYRISVRIPDWELLNTISLSCAQVIENMTAHFQGRKIKRLPQSKYRRRIVDENNYDNQLSIGFHIHDYQEEWRSKFQKNGFSDLRSVASDAMLAVAARARLPEDATLTYLSPRRLNRHIKYYYLSGIELADSHGYFEGHVLMEGYLPEIQTAISFASYLWPEDGDNLYAIQLTTTPPATLTLAQRMDLIDKAPERSRRVADFLKGVGLTALGKGFVSIYG